MKKIEFNTMIYEFTYGPIPKHTKGYWHFKCWVMYQTPGAKMPKMTCIDIWTYRLTFEQAKVSVKKSLKLKGYSVARIELAIDKKTA